MKPKVLVINHDEMLLTLLDQLLSDEGLNVSIDQIDGDCVDRVRAMQPNALVAGLNPLDERSQDFLNALASDPTCSRLPTILLTTSQVVARAISNSPRYPMVRQVLLKPFDIDDFLQAVKGAVVSTG